MNRLFRNSGLILTTLVSTTCIISAFANNGSPNKHSGLYVGGDVGTIIAAGAFLDVSAGFALGVNAGYMFNPYIGIEALYLANPYHFNQTTILSTNPYETISLRQLIQIYGGAVKLNLPIGQHFSFFIKGGIGGINRDAEKNFTDNEYAFNYGQITNTNKLGGIASGGFGYSFNQNSEITLECDDIIFSDDNGDSSNTSSSTVNASFLGLSYIYHFS